MNSAFQPIANSAETIRIYLYYRLVLSILLYLMFNLEMTTGVIGSQVPQLFEVSALIYAAFCVTCIFIYPPKQLTHSIFRLLLLLLVDLIALMVMIHASGGIQSGLGYLLLVCAAIASMLTQRRLGLGFAALISLFVMGETLYRSRGASEFTNAMFSAGTLGILLFVTALTFGYLSHKLRSSTRQIIEKTQLAEQLQLLAQHIVTRMRTGIIVIDEHQHIVLINESAMQFLDLSPNESFLDYPVAKIPQLEQLLSSWVQDTVDSRPRTIQIRAGREIRISLAKLDTGDQKRTILYMEDYRAVVQQAQQLKLASLGRLTASIAHEVRNPLGAISHAAQLLSESEHIHANDQRLIEIMLKHSKRVNQIIENTLVVSRRKEQKPELLELTQWLPRFINDYKTTKDCQFDFGVGEASIQAKSDPTHLTQVLTNLVDNGIRYSILQTGKAYILMRAGIKSNEKTPYIDIVDLGPGIPEDKIAQVFDPFYTTDEKGSGLGLYISKELCEINQSSLTYQRDEEGHSCFRISFPHHQRII